MDPNEELAKAVQAHNEEEARRILAELPELGEVKEDKTVTAIVIPSKE